MAVLPSTFTRSKEIPRPPDQTNHNVATELHEPDSCDEEQQNERRQALLIEGSGERPTILKSDSCDRMTQARFQELLADYPNYIREVYSEMDQDRFQGIPERLSKLTKRRKPLFLTKEELVSMDQWIQKRGTPLKQSIHDNNFERIAENSNEVVRDVTEAAFKRYKDSRRRSSRLNIRRSDENEAGTGIGTVEDAMKAMDILKKGLSGVHRARANLLLSVPFPDTIPYCSRALYRWLNWDERTGWEQSFRWTNGELMQTIKKVRGLAERFNVDAVAVEKVSFVLERRGLIESFKRESITKDLFEQVKENLSFSNNSTKVRKFAGSEIKIKAEYIAIKQIAKGPKLMLKFLAEVTISNELALASPDHFVKFYGWNENPDFLFIAMELVEGGDLQKNLEDNPERWDEPAIKSTAQQILQGLQFMHKAHIAHRDLKPQNILVVSSHRNNIQIKITDFGISKRLSERGTTVFQTGSGTEGYKAPEVVQQSKVETYLKGRQTPYTFNVDIWSLGCIIYRMATKERLFTTNYSKTDRELPKKVQGIANNLGTKGAVLGGTGIEFVCDLIQIEPKKRPDADDALQRLHNWVVS